MIGRVLWVGVSAVVLTTWWVRDGPLWALIAAIGTLAVTAPAAFDLGARGARRSLRRAAAKRGLDLPPDPSVERLVLDRDGYLVTGMRVSEVESLRAGHERDLRWFAGALEHHATHRVGRAIARLSTRGRVTDVLEDSTVGISGIVDKHPVRVGAPRWIGIDTATDPISTTVAVEVDDRPLGVIRLVDEIADSAAPGVQRLREIGIGCTLATRTTREKAEHVAAQVGIDDVRAPGSPEEVSAELNAAGVHAAVLPLPDGPADLRLVAEAYALARDLPVRIRRSRRLALVGSITAGLVVATAPSLAVIRGG